MVMEPKYLAFRRWLDTPIILWQAIIVNPHVKFCKQCPTQHPKTPLLRLSEAGKRWRLGGKPSWFRGDEPNLEKTWSLTLRFHVFFRIPAVVPSYIYIHMQRYIIQETHHLNSDKTHRTHCTQYALGCSPPSDSRNRRTIVGITQ